MPFASGFVGISNYLNIFIFLNKDDIRKPSHYTCETGRLPWDRTFSRAISDLLIMVILMRSAVCVLRGKEKKHKYWILHCEAVLYIIVPSV